MHYSYMYAGQVNENDNCLDKTDNLGDNCIQFFIWGSISSVLLSEFRFTATQ